MKDIPKSREEAIKKGVNRFIRDEPCNKCGERVFLVRARQNYCNTCKNKRNIKDIKISQESENYLSRL
jgi:uncharacterized OB-fold protein